MCVHLLQNTVAGIPRKTCWPNTWAPHDWSQWHEINHHRPQANKHAMYGQGAIKSMRKKWNGATDLRTVGPEWQAERRYPENKYLLNERLNVAFPQSVTFSLCPTLLCLLLGFNCSECYCHWELRYFLFFPKNQQLERYRVHTFCRNVTFDMATGHAWLLYLWFLALFLWGRSE